MPLQLKQTFPLIIWIFTEGGGDWIKSGLPFKKNFYFIQYFSFFGDWTWDTSHTFFSRWSINQIKWKISHCVRSQLLHLTNVVVCLLCFQKIHKNLQKTPPNYYLPPQLSTLYNYHLRITKLVIAIELRKLNGCIITNHSDLNGKNWFHYYWRTSKIWTAEVHSGELEG